MKTSTPLSQWRSVPPRPMDRIAISAPATGSLPDVDPEAFLLVRVPFTDSATVVVVLERIRGIGARW